MCTLLSPKKPSAWFSGDKIRVQTMGRKKLFSNEAFGVVWKNMMRMYRPINMVWHGTHPMTKTIMRLAEEEVEDHWTTTMFNRFRHDTDIAPVGFATNYALKHDMACISNNLKLLEFQQPRSIFEFPIYDSYDIVCINSSSNIKTSIDNLRAAVL